RIKIPANYVLVNVDKDFDKYHMNGQETQIYVGISAMKELDPNSFLDETQETVMTADHWADTGTIVKTPAKYSFFGSEIDKILTDRKESIDEADVSKITAYREKSLRFVTGDEFHEGQK